MSMVLVTGASGKTGREVTRALGERGVPFVRASLSPEADDERRFDFADPSSWTSALDGITGVFLLRPPPITDIDATIAPFIDEARRSGVKHFVCWSVAGAESNPLLPHAKMERRLKDGPADWTILRPDFFAQNLEDAYLDDIRQDDRIYVPAGQGCIAFLDLADGGDVAALCFERHDAQLGEAYHLTGPQAVRFAEVAAILSRTLHRSITYQPASIAGYVRHLRGRGMGWGRAAIQTYLHLSLRFGASAEVSDDVARLLGRPPRAITNDIERRRDMWAKPGAESPDK